MIITETHKDVPTQAGGDMSEQNKMRLKNAKQGTDA
jgi:hypothetical protein